MNLPLHTAPFLVLINREADVASFILADFFRARISVEADGAMDTSKTGNWLNQDYALHRYQLPLYSLYDQDCH